MKRQWIFVPALACALALAVGSAPALDENAGKTSAFERLKSLAGSWISVDESGKSDGGMTTSFKVTAGGSALTESLRVGDYEMVTVYHPDGENLVLSHFCVEGNQPRMKARRDAGPDKIVFECTGATNVQSEADRHMHRGTLTFLDDNKIHSEWLMFENGKVVYTASYRLKRQADR